MIVWFGLLFYLFFLKLLLGNLETNSKRKLFLVLAGIGIALIMGFRGDNYTNVYDLRVYKTFYANISNTPWNAIFNISEFESGFVILNKLLSCIFKWDQTIIIFEACLCVFSVSYFVYKNTKYVFESILFFVTLGAMGFMLTGIRQAIAISVCLLSFESIKKKKIFIFVLAMLIAVSIHRSAIVFVVAYFILNLKILKKKKYLNLILVLGMMLFSSLILKLGNVFSSGEISDNLDLKMSFNGIVPLILYAAAIAFQIIEDSHNVNKKDSGAIATMTSVGFGLYFLRFYNMIFERIAFYYSCGHIVALSSVFDWVDKNEMKYRVLTRLLIYSLCVFLFYHRLKTADYGQYVFFWQ